MGSCCGTLSPGLWLCTNLNTEYMPETAGTNNAIIRYLNSLPPSPSMASMCE